MISIAQKQRSVCIYRLYIYIYIYIYVCVCVYTEIIKGMQKWDVESSHKYEYCYKT